MRDLIYYVAASLDGFIADTDGSFEKFPWDNEVVADFFASYAWFDTVVMGRSTYDVAYQQGITDPYPNLKTFIVSRSITEPPHANVSLIRDNVEDKVIALKKQEGKPIWLCGGGDLAGQLFRARLIDKLILKLNPIILGKGIPLFFGEVEFASLNRTQVKEYECGISLRHYDVCFD